jgi:AcrR family transcriptional regulator
MSESARLMERLPPGRHGLSPALVEESQRGRLALAAAESLAASGYGGITVTAVVKLAGVSASTFYKRFDDLRDCLCAAYEAGAERLCERIEDACVAASGGAADRGLAGIEGALDLLASEPALAHLLSTEPPPQAEQLRVARRHLTARLATLLDTVREGEGGREREAQLIGGALALVAMQARTNGAEQLRELAPVLSGTLLAA